MIPENMVELETNTLGEWLTVETIRECARQLKAVPQWIPSAPLENGHVFGSVVRDGREYTVYLTGLKNLIYVEK